MKLNSTPGLHVDETNYMNEVISKVNFGTDIHGLKNPIYFASVWGQGQSILYAWIIVPVIKIFGFSLFMFRLPMAILTLTAIIAIVCSLYLSSPNKALPFLVTLSLVTTPWFLVSGRWVLDANVSPIFVIFGLINFYLSTLEHPIKTKYYFLVLSSVFIALSAYGYVASWIYLPFLIITMALTTILKKWLSKKEVILWGILIFILVLPLMVFAFRVNIQHTNKFSKFLIFDLPYLQANRVSSLISFKGSLFKNSLMNIFSGAKQILTGSDKLPQNSSLPYGAILPFMLIFAIIGSLGKKELFSKNEIKFRIIILESLFTFIPGLMIIKPNYNHWNFLWFPLAILTGFGLYIVFNSIGKVGKLILITIPILVFGTFTFNNYLGIGNQKTVFNASSGSFANAQNINSMMDKYYSNNNLYIENLSGNFPIFRLVQHPINDSQYLKVQNKNRRIPYKIISAPTNRYGYLRDINNIAKSRKGDLAMVYRQNLGTYSKPLSNKSEWKFIKNAYFNHYPVMFFQKK